MKDLKGEEVVSSVIQSQLISGVQCLNNLHRLKICTKKGINFRYRNSVKQVDATYRQVAFS